MYLLLSSIFDNLAEILDNLAERMDAALCADVAQKPDDAILLRWWPFTGSTET